MTRSGDGSGGADGSRTHPAKAEATLDETQQLSPERARAVMDERAHRLAMRPASEQLGREEIEVMHFALSHERYAIEARYVLEVLKFAGVTPVPGTAASLLGIANLRGEILPVFDLRELLGVAGRQISDWFRLIVVGEERAELGILADAVEEVSRLPVAELLEPVPALAGRELLRGMTKDALVLLDGEALLSDDRFCLDQS